jgi:hypothetical protein
MASIFSGLGFFPFWELAPAGEPELGILQLEERHQNARAPLQHRRQLHQPLAAATRFADALEVAVAAGGALGRPGAGEGNGLGASGTAPEEPPMV